MTLIEFAKVYDTLEDKADDILKIYHGDPYSLDYFTIEEIRGVLKFVIQGSHYRFSGQGDLVHLSFELSEMDNDLDYFGAKHIEDVVKAEREKEEFKAKMVEERELARVAKEKADYERLKKIYDN